MKEFAERLLRLADHDERDQELVCHAAPAVSGGVVGSEQSISSQQLSTQRGLLAAAKKGCFLFLGAPGPGPRVSRQGPTHRNIKSVRPYQGMPSQGNHATRR